MNEYNDRKQRRLTKDGSNTWVGIIFLVVGGLLLVRMAGFDFLDWLFQWEFILIAIGLVIGVKEGFRNLAWIILVGLGSFFLLDDIFPDMRLGRMILPAIFIGVGALILFGRNRSSTLRPRDPGPTGDPLRTSYEGSDPIQASPDASSEPVGSYPHQSTEGLLANDKSTDNVLDIAAVFGSVKKNIMSKHFRGGEVVSVFGGAHVNLLHADMEGPIVIEVVNIFGGTTLLVPNNWEIKSEAVAIFGGVEDKRSIPHIPQVPNKTLILQGFSMFGGLEIKSY
jgi:hypothetical protein